MVITRSIIAEQLSAYLSQTLMLSELVDWAEFAMMDAEFDEHDFEVIRDIISRLGVADVRAFNLSWHECANMLNQLGYAAHIQIVGVAA